MAAPARYDATGIRGTDATRTDNDLSASIKKATTLAETAPKRKHVRSCIVYTWDHRTSAPFWATLKVQPFFSDEVQSFKALILAHKVLQEGHPRTTQDVQTHVSWFENMGRTAAGDGSKDYGSLIRSYSQYLISKIHFHRTHPEFNGTFEYEEYISLKNISDPNEGYESVTDLMNLQDQIDSLQRLIFAHFKSASPNECRIAALVPLVVESYGIYKFITSMLRALYSSLDSPEILDPLSARYASQHMRLLKFYYECSNLKYLTSLIAVPKLPQDPPELNPEGDEVPPALPQRPAQTGTDARRASPKEMEPEPEPIGDFWSQGRNDDMNNFYAEQQRQLEYDQAQQAERQRALAQEQQRQFEEQQRQQEMQQQAAQDQLMREQYQRQAQGRVADLEREILAMRGQYDRDQLMLEQYDARVRGLENEVNQASVALQQQLSSRDGLIESLREQINMWKSKYESLAKLYSQLRQEHLDHLSRFKQLQLKSNSAQEAIDKKERLDKEMKNKNLELADLIRERDRARHDLDKVRIGHKNEIESLRRELERANENNTHEEKTRNAELSTALSRYNREMADLEEALRLKTKSIESQNVRIKELETANEDRDTELEVYKSSLDETLLQLNELRMTDNQNASGNDLNRLQDVFDAILQSCIQRVDDSLYELESPMQAGNQSSTPEFLLSFIERASTSATEFATSFNDVVAEEHMGETVVKAVRAASVFSNSISDVLSNAKGVLRLAPSEETQEKLFSLSMRVGQVSQQYFSSLFSFKLAKLELEDKTETVISGNINVQTELQHLAKLADSFAAKAVVSLEEDGRDAGTVVDDEFGKAAQSINAATERLQALFKKDRNESPREKQVHDSILEAATAITNAIARLIKAASDTQAEIVAQGRGNSSRAAFYKKNNRWTEGLLSAAKAVARSTNVLIDIADDVIRGEKSPEHLIVASNEVAAATAQLVASSRVKSTFGSATQDRLEDASKAVASACRALVKQVQTTLDSRSAAEEKIDYESLAPSDFKVREMEQQVAILRYEQELAVARRKLGEMRKVSYRFEE